MASKPGKVRLVRCPKCRELLTEFANIPVYKCGGCNAVLRAKRLDAGGERNASGALEKNPVERSKTGHNSKDNESVTSSKPAIPCSTDADFSDQDHDREQLKSRDFQQNPLDGERNSNAISSSGALNCHTKQASSRFGETGDQAGNNNRESSNLGIPGSDVHSFMAGTQLDQKLQFKKENALDEHLEVSRDHDQQEFNQISSRDKREEATESVDSVISEEDAAATKFAPRLGDLSKSPTTRSSYAYYGSASSYDDDCDDQLPNQHVVLTRRTAVKPQKIVDSVISKGSLPREDISGNNGMGLGSEVPSQMRKFPPRSSNEKYGSAVTGGASWNRDELSEPATKQGDLLDSEVFYSVRTWMESEIRTSSFESRDPRYERDSSTVDHSENPSNYGHDKLLHTKDLYASRKLDYLEHDRMELLRKVDQLRDRLSRGEEKETGSLTRRNRLENEWHTGHNSDPGHEQSYLQRGKVKERFPIRSIQNENQQPLCYNHNLELLQHWDPAYPFHPPGAYRSRKTIPQRCGSSKMSFSGHATNYRHHTGHSCLHCYPEGWHYPGQFPPTICYDKGSCTACPGMCHHSYTSSPSSPPRHMESSFPPRFRGAQLHDQRLVGHEMEKFKYREKRQPVKRHCRPIAGGAPFIVCYSCWKLLQLPIDFLLARRRCHKLRCGSCSEILVFSLHEGTHIARFTPSETPHPPNEVDNNTDAAIGQLASKSHANGGLQGEPICYSDDYGLSNCKSYSTEGENSLPQFPALQSDATDKQHLPSSPPDLTAGKRKLIPKQSGQRFDILGRVPESIITSSNVAKSVKSLPEAYEALRAMGSPLHKLMGYSSPSDMINRSDLGVKSFESGDVRNLENLHAVSEGNPEVKELSENGMSSHPHKDPEPRTSRESIQICEEDELLKEARNAGLEELMGNGMSSPIHKDSEPMTFQETTEICEEDELPQGRMIMGKSAMASTESDDEMERVKPRVHVNGRAIPDDLVKRAEERAGPIQAGSYWYDSLAGFWGVMGHPCLGIIPPSIEEFNYPMTKDCAGGDTGILVNGRELHQKDLDLLSRRGFPTTRNKEYIIKINGQVRNKATGKELPSLGKLAPTVEKMGCGFGMRIL